MLRLIILRIYYRFPVTKENEANSIQKIVAPKH